MFDMFNVDELNIDVKDIHEIAANCKSACI